ANLNLIREDALEAMVRYQLRSITCSIDGASPESYPQYRVKGDFETVLANIRRINELKREHHTGFPFLRWQFIVFGHNEHEIDKARKMAAELDMQFFTKLTWDESFSPVRNLQLVQIETGLNAASRSLFYKENGRDYMRGICTQIWRYPVVNWDGRVVGCCRNFWGEFGGNVFTDGLNSALNSDGLTRARDMLMGKIEGRGDLPCDTCDLYETMKRDRSWFSEAEIPAEAASVWCSVVVNA